MFKLPKPEIDIAKVFGGTSFLIGFILILTVIHILYIETTGAVHTVLEAAHSTFLTITIMLAALGLIYILYTLLAYLIWYATTPRWLKIKEGKNERR